MTKNEVSERQKLYFKNVPNLWICSYIVHCFMASNDDSTDKTPMYVFTAVWRLESEFFWKISTALE